MPITGDVFAQTSVSGDFNLKEPGQSGVGAIAPQSLEASNVDIATSLTKMILAQEAYNANTKVISTVNKLLEALDRII